MVKEYKDWLFVTVPEDIVEIEISYSGRMLVFWGDGYFNETELPGSGSWQIIGKGDAIDWEGIVDRCEMEQVDMDFKPIPNVPIQRDYFDYGKIKWYVLNTATESGLSLLRSLGMEPGTTLVLKKNEK